MARNESWKLGWRNSLQGSIPWLSSICRISITVVSQSSKLRAWGRHPYSAPLCRANPIGRDTCLRSMSVWVRISRSAPSSQLILPLGHWQLLDEGKHHEQPFRLTEKALWALRVRVSGNQILKRKVVPVRNPGIYVGCSLMVRHQIVALGIRVRSSAANPYGEVAQWWERRAYTSWISRKFDPSLLYHLKNLKN